MSVARTEDGRISVDGVDLEEDDCWEIRSAILVELGYKTDWTYIPKDALNSLFAYLNGEFVYKPGEKTIFTRQDLLFMLGAEIGDVEVENRLQRDQLVKTAKLIQDNEDKRDWV